ncbi:MAG TPA: sigma-70 family RNA polymerase sigma factor, partial [Candidatus Lustribacter sp.]|nr:sigma-70 family RNA polymerase sigma factor [Candidatus Lustribacter sp.]
MRDRAAAEEVTQEAFLEIWRTASRFDQHRGTALSWVLMIAHRKAVDRVRSAESAHRRDQAARSVAHDIPYDVTADSAYASIEAERVRGALASLSAAQRGALELAFLGGYSHSEVAAMLGLPIGTAKTRIR